ncbi:MAG: FHA domain-containing protein [Myxococcales bacterium]|nr:FHA domain-containing protein [Myxococcales bacterium]
MGKDDDCCETCGLFAHESPASVEVPLGPLLAERGGLAITVHGRRDGERTIVPTGDVITIGRGKTCDVQIDDLALSRQQCRIRLVDGHVIVEDNHSTCGTWLDGAKLGSGGAVAREGSVVFFGNSRLVLHATRRR